MATREQRVWFSYLVAMSAGLPLIPAKPEQVNAD